MAGVHLLLLAALLVHTTLTATSATTVPIKTAPDTQTKTELPVSATEDPNVDTKAMLVKKVRQVSKMLPGKSRIPAVKSEPGKPEPSVSDQMAQFPRMIMRQVEEALTQPTADGAESPFQEVQFESPTFRIKPQPGTGNKEIIIETFRLKLT